MDARVRAAYGERRRPSPWRRFWTARVSVPVPVLAALLVIVAAFWLQSGSRPEVAQSPLDGYTTRIDAAGFVPLPDGATRVIRAGGVKQ